MRHFSVTSSFQICQPEVQLETLKSKSKTPKPFLQPLGPGPEPTKRCSVTAHRMGGDAAPERRCRRAGIPRGSARF